MEIVNTKENKQKPPIQMVVYGEGGVGKTTFAAKAPNAVIADCERGTKYLGQRGMDVDVANIESWFDFAKLTNRQEDGDGNNYRMIDPYDTVVIDPIGELMEKLQKYMVNNKGSKLVQQEDGSPTMAGWGWLKRTMRDSLKVLRDTGKNVVIVAHVEEKEDGRDIVKRPKMQTKMSEELVNMVDIVGYMTMIPNPNSPDGENIRVIKCHPKSNRYIAKDRTGRLNEANPPEWHYTNEKGEDVGILDLVHSGDWSGADTDDDEDTEIPETPDGTETEPVDDEDDEQDSDDVITLEELGLSRQAIEALNNVGFETVPDIEERPDYDFEALDGVGPKTMESINEIIGDDTKDEVSEKLKQHN